LPTQYVYDGQSRLKQVIQPLGETVSYTYDALNRVDSETARYIAGGDRVIHYTYFQTGAPQALTVTRGAVTEHSVTYTLDAYKRLDTLSSLSGTGVVEFAFKDNDWLEKISRPNGLVETDYAYEADGLLSEIRALNDGTAFAETDYQYTKRGLLERITYDGGTSRYDAYGYADVPRLGSATYAADLTPARSDETFTYDKAGNREQPLSITYNDNNQLDTTSTGNFTFDGDGNMTQRDDGRKLEYDFRNRLTRLANASDATIARYAYDMLGRRYRKQLGESGPVTNYLWAGDQLIAEYDGSTGALEARYAYGLGYAPVQAALTQGATEQVYDVHTDHLDTPKFLTDQGDPGNSVPPKVVWTARQLAYGQALVDEDPDNDQTDVTFNIRFPGQYYDAESGFHYNRYRYYDPTLGRYLNADPIGQAGGVNVYGYVGENPKNRSDPLGLIAGVDDVAIGVGIGVALTAGAICAATNCGQAIVDVIDAVGEAVVDAMTATGNVADTQVVQAYAKALEAATECGGEPPDRCNWLRANAHLFRKDQVKATEKAWGCRRSRHSNRKR